MPAESRVAFALRTLCGFSTAEIARGLLTTEANVQKRIERARVRLRDRSISIHRPPYNFARLDAVLAVIYLLFSQGCHATHADAPIRRDLCDEARRLAGMLARHPVGDVPAVHALLALMCFHAARFDARVALDGAIVLLEEQDRSTWNWGDVREGMAWLGRSAAGEELTRYHVEAGIVWEHCRCDLRGHRLEPDRRRVRCARTHRTIADPRAQPRRRRSLPARPASRARPPGRRCPGKRPRPLSRLARGHRRTPLPPRPALRRRARLAGGAAIDDLKHRSRVSASPPRRLPARPRSRRGLELLRCPGCEYQSGEMILRLTLISDGTRTPWPVIGGERYSSRPRGRDYRESIPAPPLARAGEITESQRNAAPSDRMALPAPESMIGL